MVLNCGWRVLAERWRNNRCALSMRRSGLLQYVLYNQDIVLLPESNHAKLRSMVGGFNTMLPPLIIT